MNLATLQSAFAQYVRLSFSSFHRFIVAMAAIVGVFFSFAWLKEIGLGIWEGHSDCILNFGFLALAGMSFWAERERLKKNTAEEADQMLGHCIAISGIVAFPFVRFSVSLQSVLFAWIMLGLAMSHWGAGFFRRHWGAVLMTLAATYPDLRFIAVRVFRYLTPDLALERLMASLGRYGLLAIGQAATVNAQFLSLPEGSVEVQPGCSGFAMAFTLAGCSLLVGLYFKLPLRRISLLLFIGLSIALSFNVPRIMLLANASVYWGEESFEFWHGVWGGQIFASVMFTVYYYAVMAVLDHDGTLAASASPTASSEPERASAGAGKSRADNTNS